MTLNNTLKTAVAAMACLGMTGCQAEIDRDFNTASISQLSQIVQKLSPEESADLSMGVTGDVTNYCQEELAVVQDRDESYAVRSDQDVKFGRVQVYGDITSERARCPEDVPAGTYSEDMPVVEADSVVEIRNASYAP